MYTVKPPLSDLLTNGHYLWPHKINFLFLVSCMWWSASLVPRPHPRGEEKGSGYNTTSRPTLEGRNQHTIVSDHVLIYTIYGILSMPRGPHCRAYYSNCAVIGHSTCQTGYVTGSGGMSYVTRSFFSGRVGSGHETSGHLACPGQLHVHVLVTGA